MVTISLLKLSRLRINPLVSIDIILTLDWQGILRGLSSGGVLFATHAVETSDQGVRAS